MKQTLPLLAFNRGEVSGKELARIDLAKLQLAAEQQINFQPLSIGPMTLRPGTRFINGVQSDLVARDIPFIASASDTAIIELTNHTMRVLVADTLISRVAVGSTIQAFSAWTPTASLDSSVTLGPPLVITAVRQRRVSSARGVITVPGADQGKEHAIRISILIGPISFRVGMTVGGDDVIPDTLLMTGTHELTFTPAVSTLYAQFDSNSPNARSVAYILIAAAGIVTWPTPWDAADLPHIEYDQSADVVFLAHQNQRQMRIERHMTRGWSIVDYQTKDGPFPAAEGRSDTLVSPSDLRGNIVLTASKPLFKPAHVGTLIRLFHDGQQVNNRFNQNDTWTNTIRISGLKASGALGGGTPISERLFKMTLAGTWTGTLSLQRTLDQEGIAAWTSKETFAANTVTNIEDPQDNVVYLYRVGFRGATGSFTAGYGTGTAEATLEYAFDGNSGIARITNYTSQTSVIAEVLRHFSNTGDARNWRFGEFSGADRFGYPSSVRLHDGRLWYAGAGRLWGSVSDAYDSFDFEAIGDSAPIQRSIGTGPVANVRWIVSAARLAIGLDSGVFTVRSSSIDDPVTPTAFSLKESPSEGTARIRPAVVDGKIVYVEKSLRRVYALTFTFAENADFDSDDLTKHNIDIGLPGFVDGFQIAVQKQVDTHLRIPLADGKMANLLWKPKQELEAWWRVETDGVIESCIVLPELVEDAVYVIVRRTINGVTKRYREKFTRLDECAGGAISKNLDAHIVYSGSPTTVLTGLNHLEGKAVAVWADGKEVGFDDNDPTTIHTYTVSGGQITVPVAVSDAVIGLPYTGRFLSAKLAFGAEGGTALNRNKRVNSIGAILSNTHYQGLRYGVSKSDPDKVVLRSLPRTERGTTTPKDKVWGSFDSSPFVFPGDWDEDSRIYLEARGPRPCTVMGVTVEMRTEG